MVFPRYRLVFPRQRLYSRGTDWYFRGDVCILEASIERPIETSSKKYISETLTMTVCYCKLDADIGHSEKLVRKIKNISPHERRTKWSRNPLRKPRRQGKCVCEKEMRGAVASPSRSRKQSRKRGTSWMCFRSSLHRSFTSMHRYQPSIKSSTTWPLIIILFIVHPLIV